VALFKKTSELENTKNAKQAVTKQFWKVVIIDDEPGIHDVTKFALSHFIFEDKGLKFYSCYSAEEGYALMRDEADIALAFIDVVMENDQAGLDLVHKIRNELENHSTRIILRTGQPGNAPEEQVIREYDINDYKAKTELTAAKLKSCVYTSLRSYRDIKIIEQSQKGLERVISASSSVLRSHTLHHFGSAVLEQTLQLLNLDSSALYLTSYHQDLYLDTQMNLLAATGDLVSYQEIDSVEALPGDVKEYIIEAISLQTSIINDNIYVGFYQFGKDVTSILYLEHNTALTPLQVRILELFAANVSLTFENLTGKENVQQTQKELILIIGDAIEQRSKETGAHVRRVALMSEMFAQHLGMSEKFIETIRYAAPLHDVGKIGIPENILHKPGKLDAQEWAIMKTHAEKGYKLLAESNRIIAKMGARIAYTHHERWDGQGYPRGLVGEETPIEGRIMAIVDVVDALLSKRSYKPAWPPEQVKEYLIEQSGKQFDPTLCDACLVLLDKFVAMQRDLPDEKTVTVEDKVADHE
jgi:response regulator RpfG family c-di-GMP phosphodiesterase